MKCNMIRVFQFSSEIVGGYQVRVDLDTVSDIGGIEQLCVSQLIQCLLDNNFVEILSKVEQKEFHIHDTDMDTIRDSPPSQIFYICDSWCANTSDISH